MKKNFPVTQIEKPFPHGLRIVTTTDLKGIITYANDAFVEMSGFSREELVGKNHNVVRHPDMPPQAFKWLWDTLKEGMPWRGIVKNRCKNGDHYWVKALVSPVVEGGKVTGYMSVRNAPSRAEIEAADALYRQLNESGAEIGSKFDRFRFRNLSLRLKVQLILQPILFVIMTGATYTLYEKMKGNMIAGAQQRGEATAMQVIDNANMLMVTGMISDPANRKLMIRKVIEGQRLTYLRLERTEQVVRQFGPGLPEEHLDDPLVKHTIEESVAKGKAIPSFTLTHNNGKYLFRVITPYIESHDFHGTDCLTCHQVEVGSSNGASDLTIDLTKDFKYLDQMIMMLVAGQIGIQLFIFLALRFAFRRYVESPLNDVEKQFKAVIEGDLSTEIDIAGRDEPGRLKCELQVMQSHIQVMLDEMGLAALTIVERSAELDARVDQVTEQSKLQQDHVQQIASTMEEFSQSVSEVAHEATSSASASLDSQKVIEQNNVRMEMSIESTARVVQAVQGSSRTIGELKEAIQQIGEITLVIKGIADQTNLLALNAAIEAARAGEQGRGFAVVADEVRKLAERTTSSTVDITSKVSGIHATTQEVVASMDNAVREVEQGIVLARENGESLREIMETSRQLTQKALHIADASKEQSMASEDVARSLQRISELVDSNANATQEAKHASEELSSNARELLEMVKHFDTH